MSTEIDKQIVKMEFDNKNFERNTKQSLSTIDKLKKSLNFDEEAKSIRELEKAANKLTLDDLGASLEKFRQGFEGWGLVGKRIIWDLTGEFEKLGKKMISAINAPFAQIKSGGWSRAMKIKDAKFAIEGLGKNFDTLKEDINDAVSGTAYGYDSAAKAASQFAASGIQAGKKFGQMGQALRSISGVAAQTNSSYDEIANIFTTIAANGKVMTQQLRQLSFRGMNASAVLAKHLKTTESAVNEMVSKGQIDFGTFAEAMDTAFGEHATQANETFQGALDNMKAALSRVGANFADPLIDAERDVYNRVRDIINSTNKMNLTEAGQRLQENWDKIFKSHPELKTVENLQQMNRALSTSTTYLTEVGQKAKEEYDKLMEKTKQGTKATEKQAERMKYLSAQISKGTVKGSGAIIRLANVVNQSLEETRQKVLGLLEYGDVNTALNNVIDGVAELFTQIHGFIEPIEKAWRTIFPDNEIEILANITAEFKKFMQSLNLAKEYGEDVYNVFTAVFTVFDILKTIVGDLFNVIKAIAVPAMKALIKLTQPLSDIVLELDYRFRQVRAAILFVVEYFRDAANESQILSNVFNGLVKVVRVLGKILGVIATILGGALLTAIIIIGTALSKLAGVAMSIYQFLQPVISALGTFFGKVGGAVVNAIQKITQPLQVFAKGTDAVNQNVGKLGSKGIPIIVRLASVVRTAAVAIRDFVANGILKLSDAVSNFSLGDFITNIRDGFLNVINDIRSGVVTIPELLGRGLGNVIGGIANLFSKAAEAARNFFSQIFVGKEAIGKIGGVAKENRGLLGKIQDFFSGLSKSDVMQKLGDGLSTITDKIKAFTKEITPARVFALVFVAVLVMMTKAVYDLMRSISTFVTVASGVPQSISGMFDAARDVFKAMKERIAPVKKASTQFKEIAEGVVMIAASIAVLSQIKAEDLNKAEDILLKAGLFIAGYYAFMLAVSAAGNAIGGKTGKIFGKVIGSFIALSTSLLILAATLALFSKVRVDPLNTLYNLALAITALATIAVIMAVFSKFDKGIQTNALVILSFSASLLLIVNAFKKLIGIPARAMWEALIAILPVIAAVGLISLALSRIKLGNSLGLLLVIAAIALSIPILKKIAKMDWGPVQKAINDFIAIALGFLLLTTVLNFFTKGNALEGFEQFGSGLIKVAEAFAIFAIITSLLGRVDGEILKKGVSVLGLYTLMVVAMEAASVLTNSNDMRTFGVGLLLVGTYFGMLTALTVIIGSMDVPTLAKGVAVLGIFTLMVAGLMWTSQFTKGVDSKSVGLMISITISIIALCVTLSVLAEQPFEKLMAATVAVGAVMLSYGYIIKQVGNLAGKTDKVVGTIALLLVTLGSMLVLFYAMEKLSSIPWNRLIPAAGSMAICMLAFGGAIKLIEGSLQEFSISTMLPNLALMAVAVLAFGTIGQTVAYVSKQPWQNIIASGGAMCACMIAFAYAFNIIEKSLRQFKIKTMLPNLALMAVAAVAIGVIGLVMAEVAKQPWDQILASGASMSACILSFAGAIKMMQKEKLDVSVLYGLLGALPALITIGGMLYLVAQQPWDQILAAGGAMAACIMAVGVMMKLMNNVKIEVSSLLGFIEAVGIIFSVGIALTFVKDQPWQSILAAGSMIAACLVAVGVMMRIISGVNVNISTLFGFIGACGAIISIGYALSLAAQHPWQSILAAGGMIVACLLSMTLAITILGAIPVNFGIMAALNIISFIGLLAGGLFLMDQIIKFFGGNGLDDVVDLFEKMGEMVGGFISGIGKGLASELPGIGSDLSAFAENAKPFFDAMQGIDGSSIKDSVTAICDMIMAIAGYNLMDSLDILGNIGEFFTGESHIDELGENFSILGEALQEFAKSTEGVDAEQVKTAAEAISIIMSAFTNMPQQNSGGNSAYGVISDKQSIEDFSAGLDVLGPALVTFCENTKDLSTDGPNRAKTVMDMIVEFSKELPNTGGLVSAFTGDNDLSTFAENIPMLGLYLKRFSILTEGMSSSAISNAGTVMKMINEFATNVPNTGGLITFFSGDNEFSTFIEKIPTLGEKLKEFTNNLDGANPDAAVTFSGIISGFARAIATIGSVKNGSTILSTFAQSLPGIATDFGTFQSKIPESMPKKLSEFMKSMNSLKSFVSGFSNIATTDLINFTKDLSNMSLSGLDLANSNIVENLKATMSSAIMDIEKTYEEYKGAGANQVQSFANGIKGAFREVNSAWQTSILDGVLYNINNVSGPEFNNAGAGLTGMFANGIARSDKIKEVQNAASKMAKEAIGAINDIVKNPYSGDDAYKAGSNLANTFVMNDSDLAQFTNAGSKAITSFVTAISNGGDSAVKAFGDIVKKVSDNLLSTDNQNKISGVGKRFTKSFGSGIGDTATVNEVLRIAGKVGTDAVNRLDNAIKDPEGISDETLRLGRAFTRGFGMGIESLRKYSDQASADIGYKAVEHLDDAIEDPAGVSDKTFDLGKAFGNGFKMGIESFMSAVNNAASALGISGINGLDISLEGISSRIKKFVSDTAGGDFAEGLFGAITGVTKKAKNYKKELKKFYKSFMPKTEDKKFADDIEKKIDNISKTGDKKGSGGKGKSGATWTNKDATESILYLKNIFKEVEVKYDAFNKNLLNKGKATAKYIASSIKNNHLANVALYLDKDGKVSKKINKQADKIYKDIYDAQLKVEKKKQKKQAAKKGTKFTFNKAKAEENIRAKAVEQATRKVVENYEKEYDAYNTMLKGMVSNKTARKALKSMPSMTGTFIKTYASESKKLKENLGELGETKGTNAALKAYTKLGNKLYKQTDEYKENKKQLVKNGKEYDKLQKKAKKLQSIIDDPKASAKRKQAAKKKLAAISKEVTDLEKANKKIAKQMAKGPGKAIKTLKKDIKEAVKSYLAFSNIDFGKVISGFEKKMEGTNLQEQGYDIFSASLLSLSDATKAATDAFGILDVGVASSINLLERFAKVSSTSARRLLKNAESQIKAYEEYKAGIQKLREKGLDERMIKQLEDQGTGALSQIRGFLKMSADDISKYNAIVGREEAIKASETENNMIKQVDKYKKWVENLEKLSSKIPQKMLAQLRSGGVSNADFVETLLYMDDATLKKVTDMYTESLKQSVDNAMKTVADATENKGFKEQIKKMNEEYDEWSKNIAKLKTLGVSDAVIEKLKSMGVSQSKAYIEELLKETKEGIEYINTEYEKSLYGGKSAADVWFENMKVSNDTYSRWTQNMTTIGAVLGHDDPVYKALKEMGWESGAEYAEAFVKASDSTRQLIEQEFERQREANSKAIIQSMKDRIETIKKWRDDIRTLAERKLSDGKTINESLMAELVTAGPEDYEKVHALVEMSDQDLKTFSDNYADAMKLPASVAESVKTSYASIFTDSVDGASDAIKSDDSKNKLTKSTKGTIKSVAAEAKPYAKSKGSAIGKQGVNGITVYMNKSKGREIGSNLGKGLSNGMSSISSMVASTARTMARKAYLAIKNELKVKSPSRATYEIGKFFDMGLADGIKDYSKTAENSSSNMANVLTKDIANAFSSVNDIAGNASFDYADRLRESMMLLNDVDLSALSPIIHPTLDLSGVTGKVDAISAQMSLDKSTTIVIDDIANENVVKAISSMKEDFGNKIEELSAAMHGMQVVMDSGALVGEIAGPVDAAIGKRMANRRRGM